MDIRQEKIGHWAASLFPNEEISIKVASSDASFRRYFRLTREMESLIIMDAPPEHEDIVDFCRIARRFHALGINVPEILASDVDSGFVLMSDLGNRHYLDCLNESNVDELYADAMRSLVSLQAGTHEDPQFLPPYSEKLLRDEMNLYREWYLGVHLGVTVSEQEHRIMDDAWDILVRSALEQPQLWVHRDFHSRNLMVTGENSPGIIDFQDAVTGPITYDLVSLFKDCYIEWPLDRVENWVLQYQELALQAGLLEDRDNQRFLRWFHRMGIQRHLKVAGIFARLYHRDGKDGYLNDIPLTLHYLVSALAGDPELAALHELVSARIES